VPSKIVKLSGVAGAEQGRTLMIIALTWPKPGNQWSLMVTFRHFPGSHATETEQAAV
jgi:hypothetical protein